MLDEIMNVVLQIYKFTRRVRYSRLALCPSAVMSSCASFLLLRCNWVRQSSEEMFSLVLGRCQLATSRLPRNQKLF